MPLPFIDFTKVPLMKRPTNETFGNLLESALGAYQGGKQFSAEQKKRVLSGEEQVLKNALLREYGREREQAEVEFLKNKALASQYAPQQALADIDFTKAQAFEKYNPRTAAQIELKQAFGGDNEGMARALRRKYGSYDSGSFLEPTDVIPNEVIGQPLEALPKISQNAERKEMQTELKKAINMSETIPLLDDLEKLVDQHPELWKSASLILNAKSSDEVMGVKDLIKKNLINEKEKTAIDKFAKITSTLIAKGGEALGSGQRLTDARQSLIASMKPEVSNTPEANKYIIQGMKKLMSAGPTMERAYRWGLKNNVSILNDPEAFRNFKPRTPLDNQEVAGEAEARDRRNSMISEQMKSGMVPIRNKKTGETRYVTQNEADAMGAS